MSLLMLTTREPRRDNWSCLGAELRVTQSDNGANDFVCIPAHHIGTGQKLQ